MAFPVPTFTVSGTTGATSYSANWPATVEAGDLLIVSACCDGSGDTVSFPAGDLTDNLLFQDNNNHGWSHTYKIADGSEEGGTFTVTHSSSEGGTCVVIRVTGWHGTTLPEAAFTEFSGDDWEVVTLTPSGWDASAEDTLWIWMSTWDGGDKAVNGFPTEVPDNRSNDTFSAASAVAGLARATRNLAATSLTTSELTSALSSAAGTAQGLFAVRPAAGAALPELTDVDTDEVITEGQEDATFTGTNLGATTGDRTIELVQGAVEVEQTQVTGNATGGTFDVVMEATADIKFGAATFRVTVGENTDTIAVTVNPASGQIYVDLTSVETESGDRITATPDLEVGDQLHARGVGGGAVPTGLTLNADGTFQFSAGNEEAPFDVRVWDVNDATWGAFATQSVADNDVAATGAVAFGSAASLTAQGTLEAVGAVAYGSAADLDATGTLAATGAVVFASAASLVGDAGMVAVGALAFAGSADLDATGTLAATASVVFDSDADLEAIGVLAGAGAIAFGASADLAAIGELAATGALQWTASAGLVTNDIAATGALSFASSADLAATGTLAGAGAIAFTSDADLVAPTVDDISATGQLAFGSSTEISATGTLAAVGAIAFVSDAHLSGPSDLTASAAMQFGEAAVLMGAGALRSAAQVAFDGTGILKAIGEMESAASLAWTSSAALTDPAAISIIGASASMRRVGSISATVRNVAAKTATLN